MASTNQSPFYQQAEAKFLNAQTDKERLKYLDEMIKECPKHKSSEKMLANLKTRRKKLLNKLDKSKKSGKSNASSSAIKKHDMQAVIVGKTNTGKSSLLSLLTNTNPLIADYNFTTKISQQGILDFKNAGVQIQLIESPAIESDYFDKGLVNSADTLIFLITKIEDIAELESKINNSKAKQIIVFNKSDLLNETEKRKLEATLRSKKYNFVLISTKEASEQFRDSKTSSGERGVGEGWESKSRASGIEQFKEKIFKSFNKIRVYTKEPGKEKTSRPIILNPNSTVKDIAEKILHGFSKQVVEVKIWGPSSKFPGQKVSLKHELKDLDIVEFKTR